MTAENRKAVIHRAGSLALLGVVVLAAALAVVAPVAQATFDARDEVSAARERLAALRAKRVDRASLEAVLKRETAQAADRPWVFEAATPADGLARVEAQMRSLASLSEAEMSAARPLRIDDENGLKALRFEVSMRVPGERLTSLLAAIEAAHPTLFLERVRVTSDASTIGRGDDRLDASIIVRGLAAIGSQHDTAPRTAVRR